MSADDNQSGSTSPAEAKRIVPAVHVAAAYERVLEGVELLLLTGHLRAWQQGDRGIDLLRKDLKHSRLYSGEVEVAPAMADLRLYFERLNTIAGCPRGELSERAAEGELLELLLEWEKRIAEHATLVSNEASEDQIRANASRWFALDRVFDDPTVAPRAVEQIREALPG